MKDKIKKSLIFILVIFCAFLISCKDIKEDIDWVNDGIASLSDEIDLDDEKIVNAIRLIYDGLNEKEKKKIKEYQKLVDAENKIYELKKEDGLIVELKYSTNVESAKLEYTYINEKNEKVISDKTLEEFLLKLSEVSGEKEKKKNFDQNENIKIIINDDVIICYLNNNYFTYNENTYVLIKGDLNFVFDYFK